MLQNIIVRQKQKIFKVYIIRYIMKRLLYSTIITFSLLISLGITLSLSFSNVAATEQNATMTVEANIIGFANGSTTEEVSIEVPDYVFLGNVTKDEPVSDELKLYINNTGKVAITVTPQLKDPEEIIFSYLFFRLLKTSNGTAVPFTRIGDFSMNIDKPTSGSSYKSKYFYMKLDLTEFDGDIKEDLIGYRTDILFLAMPQ